VKARMKYFGINLVTLEVVSDSCRTDYPIPFLEVLTPLPISKVERLRDALDRVRSSEKGRRMMSLAGKGFRWWECAGEVPK